MINSDLVRSYYRDYQPWLPPRPGWYHFRVRCLDGSWKKLRRITSPEKLRKELFWSDAGDVYFSAAKWLNPEKISFKKGLTGRPGYIIADNLFLGSDYVFDFDAHNRDEADLEVVRKRAARLYNFMKKKRGFRISYILFSGKGFHIAYTHDEKQPVNPLLRVGKNEKNRKKYKKSLPKNIIFDTATLLNPLLVRRLPGTINTKSGNISTIITEKTLKTPIQEWINHIPQLLKKSGRPGKPLKRLMTNSFVSSKKRLGGAAGLAPPTTIIIPEYCYTNKVSGARDRYVLILKYGPLQKYWRDTKFLMDHYKLGIVYVLEGTEINKHLELEKRLWIVTAQTYPHKRLLKMLKRTRALNKNQQSRIKQTLMPIQKYRYIDAIKSPNPVKAASKSHRRIITRYTNKRQKSWTLEGNNNIKIIMHNKKR
jgi:hypothetical protein